MWILIIFSAFASVNPISVDGFETKALCDSARTSIRTIAPENARSFPGALTVCVKSRNSAVGSF